jgi:hypothetical protein
VPPSRVIGNCGLATYVEADAAMTDSVLQTLAIGVVVTLLAFELVVAFASWLEATGGRRSNHRTPVHITRPFAIRDHFRERRLQLNALRGQYPVLRLPDHGRRVRDAIRGLQPTRLTATLTACPDCRGSRMRGLPRCPGCARRLIEPAHALA